MLNATPHSPAAPAARPRRFRPCPPAPRRCALAVTLAVHGWAATAQTAPAAATVATPLAEITLTATRTERRVDEVPATVSVTTAQEAETAGATDLHSLFRTAVDLSVRRGPTRFGATVGTAGRA